ncbi:hypothetical protein PF011_g6403 [Phytophthora fragariae]|uniref:Uncharacterized protein n=1 Tax=Phytophthora fragariae TaxID=53985 RepID=A0A6A3LFC4_9STRA|nr:hypothetical protein PF011_g6403 [Phytophthora fragariae]
MRVEMAKFNASLYMNTKGAPSYTRQAKQYVRGDQELRTRIQSVVSGEYCQLLLSVFGATEVEFVAFASASG